jgi:hypothetical protein
VRAEARLRFEPRPFIIAERRSIELPRPKPVLVRGHIYALTAEPDAFHFEARSLLERRFKFQLDLAACADHSLPG